MNFKYNFNGCDGIEKSYSQSFQDIFALTMLDGKADGYYFEVGANDPIEYNNTYIFETKFNWSGVSLELDNSLVNRFNSIRANKCICADATSIDYMKLFIDESVPKQIDYLQLDIEPASGTFAALEALPLDDYRFSVITYEHDKYNVGDFFRDESRKIFNKHGYQLVVSDLACRGGPGWGQKERIFCYEDWYVDPKIIEKNVWEKFISDNVLPEILFNEEN
jgi:hypothetical protein